MICPCASLMPVIPPTLSAPLTAPENVQFVMVPPVFPGQAAQGVLAVGGGKAARDVQIPHDSGGLYVAEQALHIAAVREGQPGNGMPMPLKGPAKGGDGGEVHAGQVDVTLQINSLSLGPAVQRTVPGKRRQIFR